FQTVLTVSVKTRTLPAAREPLIVVQSSFPQQAWCPRTVRGNAQRSHVVEARSASVLPIRAWNAWRDRGTRYTLHKALRRSLGPWPEWKRRLLYGDPQAYWTLRGGDDYFREQEGQAARTQRSEWLASRIASYRPASILEIGCGYGKQLGA